ncbi:MAG: methyltransferase domain-containing protein, partial [Candidatus Atribacteria bacterium]|nr:methyltransferase domain-containing protein [Candidatus Atribacteria bacterium]
MALDFDPNLNPDRVGSVLNIPFEDNFFEVVACYEVLEHLPFENFNKAISEIFRVSKSWAILSLPDVSRAYRFNVQ